MQPLPGALPVSRRTRASRSFSTRGSGSRRPTWSSTAGDLDVLYYDEPVVALSPIAEERVQMAFPMKPLCREDCKGLCVVCGKDLNQGPCACAPETFDPRWEALKALKEKV